MNYNCVYCGHIIDRTDGHCNGCGAVAAATLYSNTAPTQDYDYMFACKKIENYKIEGIGKTLPNSSHSINKLEALNKEDLGLKQIAFQVKFTNLGKNTLYLYHYNKFNANNEREDVLPIKLFADDELTQSSSVGPIDSNYLKEENGKVFAQLGRMLYMDLFTLQCNPGESIEGWIGFYVPFQTKELKLIIGSKQIIMDNPFNAI